VGRRERRLAELGTKKVMRSPAAAHRDMRPVVALLILPDAQLKYSRRCHATTPDAENSSHHARQSADRVARAVAAVAPDLTVVAVAGVCSLTPDQLRSAARAMARGTGPP
jgi:hypothetical protein